MGGKIRDKGSFKSLKDLGDGGAITIGDEHRILPRTPTPSPTPAPNPASPYGDIPGITGSRQFDAWMPGQAESVASQLAGGFGSSGMTAQSMLAELLRNTANMKAPIYGAIQTPTPSDPQPYPNTPTPLPGGEIPGERGTPTPTPNPRREVRLFDQEAQARLEKMLQRRGMTLDDFFKE